MIKKFQIVTVSLFLLLLTGCTSHALLSWHGIKNKSEKVTKVTIQSIAIQEYMPLTGAECRLRDKENRQYDVIGSPVSVDLVDPISTKIHCTVPGYQLQSIAYGYDFSVWTVDRHAKIDELPQSDGVLQGDHVTMLFRKSN